MAEQPRRPADLAGSLLRRVLSDQLDPGYRQAAARRGGAAAGGRAQLAWLLVGGLLVGGLLGVAGANAAARAPGAEQVNRALVTEVIQARERTDELQLRADEVAAEFDRVRGEALTGNARGARTLQEVARLQQAVAAVAVTGPGLRVTIADPPSPPGTGLRREQTVLDRDLQVLLNALWSAGAEAIAIGEVRVHPLATVRQAGGAMLVGNRPVGQPYVVEVLGNPAQLQTRFVQTDGYVRFHAFAQIYGTRFDIESVERLVVPAGDVARLRLAEPLPSATIRKGDR